jgi:hypothetical protein
MDVCVPIWDAVMNSLPLGLRQKVPAPNSYMVTEQPATLPARTPLHRIVAGSATRRTSRFFGETAG